MKLIATATITGSPANLVFSAIPQTFTDLVILISAKGGASTSNVSSFVIQLNGTGGGTFRNLRGSGATVTSGTGSNGEIGLLQRVAATGFGSTSVYIPNYTGTTGKSISSDSVTENNATAAFQQITATLYSTITTGVTEISFGDGSTGLGLAVGSTASLYGITKGSSGGVVVS